MTADDGVPPWARHHIPRFEALVRSLERVPGFILQPIEVPSRDVAQVLAGWLTAHRWPARWVAPLDDPDWAALASTLTTSRVDARVVVVSGPLADRPGIRHGLAMVNLHRDGIVRTLGCPLLWCGLPEFLRATWEEAPDFWSIAAIPRSYPRNADVSWIPHLDVDWTVVRSTDLTALRDLYSAARDQGDSDNQLRLGIRLIAGLQHLGDEWTEIAGELGKLPWGFGFSLLPLNLSLKNRPPLESMLAERNSPHFQAQLLLHLGVLSRRTNRVDDARRELLAAIDLLAQVKDSHSELLARLKLCELELADGRIDAADAQTKRLLDLHDALDPHDDLLDFTGLVLCLVEAAHERFQWALDTVTALGQTDDEALPSLSAAIEHVAGCLRIQIGDVEGAQAHLADALAKYEALGAADGVAQVIQSIASFTRNE